MTKPAPSIDQIMKRKFAGHSHERVIWETHKKDWAKVVDTSVFKKGLGPALDTLNSMIKGAEEVKRYYPKLDDRTLKPVREARTKVEKIAAEYVKLCQAQKKTPGLTKQQQQAWGVLSGAAENVITKAKAATQRL